MNVSLTYDLEMYTLNKWWAKKKKKKEVFDFSNATHDENVNTVMPPSREIILNVFWIGV